MNYLHLVPWSPRTTFGGYETIIRDAAKTHHALGYGTVVVGRRNDSYLGIETHHAEGVPYVEYVDVWKRRPSTLDVGVIGLVMLIAEILYSHIVLTPIVIWQVYARKIDVVIFYGIHLFLMSPILRLLGVKTLLGLEVIQKRPDAPKTSLLGMFRSVKYACFSGIFTYTKVFRYRDGTTVDNVALLSAYAGKKKVLYLPWGIDVASVRAVKKSKEATVLRKKYSHIIVCPRRLVAEKGVRYLLEAAPSVLSKIPNAVIVFAGDGLLRGELTNRARELRVHEHVVFTGFMPHAETMALIRESDVTVVPSSGEESFGMVFLESYALETPVVTTWFGGITNVVKNGETGVVVDPADPDGLAAAIVTVLKRPALAKKLTREAGKQVEQQYEIRHVLEKLDAFASKLS